MLPEDQERLLAPILERWAEGDFSTWDEHFAPDLLLSGFDGDGNFRARGPREIAQNLRRFFGQFRNYRIEPGPLHRLSEDLLLMKGVQFATGRLSEVAARDDLCIVFRFDTGRLTEMHWHPTREGALEAAGLGAG